MSFEEPVQPPASPYDAVLSAMEPSAVEALAGTLKEVFGLSSADATPQPTVAEESVVADEPEVEPKSVSEETTKLGRLARHPGALALASAAAITTILVGLETGGSSSKANKHVVAGATITDVPPATSALLGTFDKLLNQATPSPATKPTFKGVRKPAETHKAVPAVHAPAKQPIVPTPPKYPALRTAPKPAIAPTVAPAPKPTVKPAPKPVVSPSNPTPKPAPKPTAAPVPQNPVTWSQVYAATTHLETLTHRHPRATTLVNNLRLVENLVVNATTGVYHTRALAVAPVTLRLAQYPDLLQASDTLAKARNTDERIIASYFVKIYFNSPGWCGNYAMTPLEKWVESLAYTRLVEAGADATQKASLLHTISQES